MPTTAAAQATPTLAAWICLTGGDHEQQAIDSLARCEQVRQTLVIRSPQASARAADTATTLVAASWWDQATLSAASRWLDSTTATHVLVLLPGAPVVDPRGVARLTDCAHATGASWTYSDYWDLKSDQTLSPHALIDYQCGSVRDDFDFGTAVLIRRDHLISSINAASQAPIPGPALRFGAWYDLRLRLMEAGCAFRVAENLYQYPNPDTRLSGQKNFDYCDPRARDYQIEMERVATAHLKRVGAWLPPPRRPLAAATTQHPVVASVIIPVRNRVKTVGDAVRSALAQKASFPFNVIVIDNHSDDGTTELLAAIARDDKRLVHLMPERRDLLIGGCWNEGVHSRHCGEFAVQLDSDDIYSADDTLERIIAVFRSTNAALVVGSYTIVNFNLEELPPGLIDHKEWTDDNGHNNALRIAGLGAPRAYHVPTLRSVGGFPNTSYGEDYGAVIRLCREYPVGRIYDSLYWCRRWEGNSDSALPLETSNRYSVFKDRLRTIEIAARRRLAGERA